MVVLLPNTGPGPNPELWPNAGAVVCPNSPDPVLLAVLALLVPKEKELALVAVAAPKRLPPVVALLELAPNADWPKEKPPGVSVLVAGWPKPLTWPNTEFPKPGAEGVPNAVEPNPGAEGAGGTEEAGGAAGCPKTVLAVVAVLTTVEVGVVPAAATVLITGVAPRELLSVIVGVV